MTSVQKPWDLSQETRSLHDIMVVIICLMSGEWFYKSSYLWAAAWRKIYQTEIGRTLLAGLDFQEMTERYTVCDAHNSLMDGMRRAGQVIVKSREINIADSKKDIVLAEHPVLLEQHEHDLRTLAQILEKEITPIK